MNNFPFYQQFNAEIICKEDTVFNDNLVDQIANKIIEAMELTVVSKGKHDFSNNGQTKYWILSQSHMIIHTWPEFRAIHLDLITCSPNKAKDDFSISLKDIDFESIRLF
jgi:S-adenosylmethionine/arginine decarboxylase-like enzyme